MNFFLKIILKIFPYSLLFKILRRLISGKVNSMNLKPALKELLVFDNYLKNSENSKIVLENFKLSKNFTIFNHYKKFSKYLSQ